MGTVFLPSPAALAVPSSKLKKCTKNLVEPVDNSFERRTVRTLTGRIADLQVGGAVGESPRGGSGCAFLLRPCARDPKRLEALNDNE